MSVILRAAAPSDAAAIHSLVAANLENGSSAAAVDRGHPRSRRALLRRRTAGPGRRLCRAGEAERDGGGSPFAGRGRVAARPEDRDSPGRSPGFERDQQPATRRSAHSPTRRATSSGSASRSCRTSGCRRRSRTTATAAHCSAAAVRCAVRLTLRQGVKAAPERPPSWPMAAAWRRGASISNA